MTRKNKMNTSPKLTRSASATITRPFRNIKSENNKLRKVQSDLENKITTYKKENKLLKKQNELLIQTVDELKLLSEELSNTNETLRENIINNRRNK